MKEFINKCAIKVSKKPEEIFLIYNGRILTEDSNIKVMVIPTDEESVILNDTIRLSNVQEHNKTLEKK